MCEEFGADNVLDSYYKNAKAAANREGFDSACEICLNAIKHFDQDDQMHKKAEAYHLLGQIAYRQGELDKAESWYQEALSIDANTGDELGTSRTYNNLSSVACEREEYDKAESWLEQSIRIKEKFADKAGLAVSYHQLGQVAEMRMKFIAAEGWFLKSLKIKKELNNLTGIAKTCLRLSLMAKAQGKEDLAKKWREEALCVIESKGSPGVALKLGIESEQLSEYELAEILYHKALEIAKNCDNHETESLSYLYLAHLACQLLDYDSAKNNYENSIIIDDKIHASERAARSRESICNLEISKKAGLFDGIGK